MRKWLMKLLRLVMRRTSNGSKAMRKTRRGRRRKKLMLLRINFQWLTVH
jgi:hypothetical protein